MYILLLAVALLDLGLYSVKNEEFWNSEVGRAAVEHHLENMSNKRIRGRRSRRRRKTVAYSSIVKMLKKIRRISRGGSWKIKCEFDLYVTAHSSTFL